MQVHAFVDEGLGHSSYVIDLGDGTAAIVDPPRFPAAQEQFAAREGLRLRWTVDTHSHADYVTGSPGLVARLGAVFLAPAASRLATPHRPLEDGDRVPLGSSVVLVAIATPGHTPDHHAYLIELDGRPVALFSGGSLMVGTVGRTDLCGPTLAEPLAHDMFRSLQRFDQLPDDVALYPTHGAGSFCSAPGASERTSTLGRERLTNPLLATVGEDEFVEHLIAGFGSFPAYFGRLPELNRLGPTRFDALPALAGLDVETFSAHRDAGATVVDARPFGGFGAGHVPGSLSNALRPVFASWLGWLVAPTEPLLFVLEDGQDRAELVRQCLDVGHELLLGELDGGMAAWRAAGRATASVEVVDVGRMAASVLDVRQAGEYAAGHVPGARHVELGSIADADFPDQPLTVMCGHGERAMTAASLLAARGMSVSCYDGGPATWADFTGRQLELG